MAHARIPSATYRFQFNSGFTFADAAQLVDYLTDLGVTDVYASPILAASTGSLHGYDVIDHSRLNPELGSEEDFAGFSDRLQAARMGLLMDVVPNHMCVEGGANLWWNDVLENGQSSVYADYFDIDWDPPKPGLKGKVLLPVLGEQFGKVLESAQIQVLFRDGCFFVTIFELHLPMAPRTFVYVLGPALATMISAQGEESAPVKELESIIRSVRHLPPRSDATRAAGRERHREKEAICHRMRRLVAECPEVADAIAESVEDLNGRVGEARSFDRLEELLGEQGYRLSFWRVATDEINYRRFFDINSLAAVRVEERPVFEAVHQRILDLAAQGRVTGLRIDHIDGLWDPTKYLEDLQSSWARAIAKKGESDAGAPCYVLVEKILSEGEKLRSDWPTHGTTGYEFMNLVNGLFVDGRAAARLRAMDGEMAEGRRRFADVVYASKKLVLRASLSSELTVLSRRLDRLSEQHRFSHDFTFSSLRRALAEVVACFPVYRTYVRPGEDTVSPDDRLHVEDAVLQARRRNPTISRSIFTFIRDLLLLEHPEGLEEKHRSERRDFVVSLQQVTSPVMAKGVEDTAFYRYFPLASLNEVGGEPGRIGISRAAFHAGLKARCGEMPAGLSATATHDNKRGEDVRARINVLSEIVDSWSAAVERWRAMNQRFLDSRAEEPAPTRLDEYLLYQTLIGAWPIGGMQAEPSFVGRVHAYMEKALKEAKLNTSWINPNEDYDRSVQEFIDCVLDPKNNAVFLDDFETFHRALVHPAYWNGLSQTIIKLTAPGVPDIYQGCELWDHSLVDPDNRRRVDYEKRKKLLATLKSRSERDPAAVAEQLRNAPDDGAIKLWLMSRVLPFRRANQQVFSQGDYLSLEIEGPRAEQAIAFARTLGDQTIITVAARFFTRFGDRAAHPVGDVWQGTRLLLPAEFQSSRSREVLTNLELRGGELPLDQVFAHLPVACLEVSRP